jgi:hypothetical protein
LSWYPASITVVSVADTLGNSFSDAGVVTQSASTQSFKGDVWYAMQTHASGSDTITVTLSGTPTVVWITCLEFSGTSSVLRVAEKTSTGTGTSSPLSIALSSFTPSAGDLVYAYTAYQTCQSTGTITYNTAHYLAGTAKGTDFRTGTRCRTYGDNYLQQNEADEYWQSASASSTTATFSVPSDGNQAINVAGWIEVGVEFEFQDSFDTVFSKNARHTD